MSIENFRQQVFTSLPSLAAMVGTDDGRNIAHPTHGSTTGGNLSVNGNLWFCHRCKAGGSKFEWIAIEQFKINCDDAADYTTTNFMEVLKHAAERTSLKFPEFDSDTRERYLSNHKKHGIFEVVQDFFVAQLKQHPEVVEEIKQRRGFTDAQIEEYGFGFSPIGDKLESYLKLAGIKTVDIYQLGLLSLSSGKYVPHFQGRITIPNIIAGKVDYWYARSCQHTPRNKYELYSNGEFIKFKKLRVHSEKNSHIDVNVQESVFGLNTIDRDTKQVIVVEGIADALSLMSWGYSVISPITTRFKGNHKRLVKNILRNVPEIYICNDNEKSNAGLEGAFDTLDFLPRAKIVLLPLPEGSEKIDINDYYKTHSKEDFDLLLATAELGWEVKARIKKSPVDYAAIACAELGINTVKIDKLGSGKDAAYKHFTMQQILKKIHSVSMSDVINAINRAKGANSLNQLSNNEKNQIIAKIILRDMLNRDKAEFLIDRTQVDLSNSSNHTSHYVWYFDGRKIINLQKLDFYLSSDYAIADPTQSELIAKLILHQSLKYGSTIILHKMYHYNKETNTLYFQNGIYQYYQITTSSIELKQNGEDGIFFQTTNVEAIEYVLPKCRKFKVKNGMPKSFPQWIKKAPFTNLLKMFSVRANIKSDGILTREERWLLMGLQLFIFPFFQILAVRPIILCSGPTQSGKSFWLENVCRILTNTEAMLQGEFREQDQRTMDNYLVSKPAVFLDDIQNTDKKLINRLIGVSTGQAFASYKMYQEFGVVEQLPNPFIGITTNEPSLYTKHDLVNRSLYFNFEVIPVSERLDEDILKGELVNNFDELRSEYFDILQLVLRQLENGIPKSKVSNQVRFSEWVKLAFAVSKALKIDPKLFNSIILKLENEMNSFIALNDRHVSLLSDYVIRKGFAELTRKVFTTTSDFYEDVLDTVPTGKSIWRTVAYFGRVLSQKSQVLKDYVGIVREEHPRYVKFKFEDKRSQLEIIAEVYSELPDTFDHETFKVKMNKHRKIKDENLLKILDQMVTDGQITLIEIIKGPNLRKYQKVS